MSARVSRVAPPKAANRNTRRKMVLDVDLNSPAPPFENGNDVGTSSCAPGFPQRQPVQIAQPRVPPQLVPIDVDALDDDVLISSPRAFAEAKNNSRRNRNRSNVVDVDIEIVARHASTRNKRQRAPINQPVINCDLYVIPEGHSNAVNGNGKRLGQETRTVAPPPPPPPEPKFSCPVCMGPLVEEVSTKCGHIFCKACIKQAIAAQNKCPTCRRRVTMKDTIRIYLPATNLP